MEMKQLFNIELTSVGKSGKNGLNDGGHQVIDGMMEVMEIEHLDCPLDILLGMVKNTMYDHRSYTPNQLVYGTNPTLQDILTNGLPTIEGKTQSEILNGHLDIMQPDEHLRQTES